MDGMGWVICLVGIHGGRRFGAKVGDGVGDSFGTGLVGWWVGVGCGVVVDGEGKR